MNPIDLATASAIGKNASECLAMLAVVGALVGIFRYRRAVRSDFVAAWIVVMVGVFVSQVPVYLGGMVGWGADLVLLSAIGRIIQITGAILFVRAVLRDECSPVAWVMVVGVALLAAVVL